MRTNEADVKRPESELEHPQSFRRPIRVDEIVNLLTYMRHVIYPRP